jgi:PAS domain S-box-containing protein
LFVAYKLQSVRGKLNTLLEREEAEREIQRRDALIHALFDQSRDPIMILHPATKRFTSANRAALDIFGIADEEELRQLSPWDISPVNQFDGEPSQQKGERVTATALEKGSFFFEWDHQRKDGTIVPCTVLLSAVKFADEVYLQASLRDISELRAKESELQKVHKELIEEKLQLENLIRNAPGVTYRFRKTPDGRMYFPFASAQAAEIYGIPAKLFEENPAIFVELIHPEDVSDLAVTIEKSAQTLTEFQWDGRIVRPSGEVRWIHAKSIPRRDFDGGVIWDGLMLDITDKKISEQHLAEERSKSMHAAKLASLGEMSAGVAHEINNPLAIIQSNLQLMKKLRNDEPKFNAKIESAEKAVLRIIKIVNGLRKFSRSSDSPEFSTNAISEIAAEACIMVEAKAKRNSVFVELVNETRSKVVCDAIEIEQVVINLVNNAIDAGKGKPGSWVKVHTFDTLNEVVVRVIDSGSGIPKDVETKMFQPFFTTKPVGGGTGLGLSICKGIVENHRGSLFINRNMPNTCFELRLKKLAASDFAS